jgi:hypothetical protein
MTDVVERFERHATGQRAIADNGENRLLASASVSRQRDAERHREGIGRVAGVKGIKRRLTSLGESAYAAVLAKRREALSAARDELVDIRLMPHVEDDAIRRTIESAMNPQGKLDDSEVWGQMATGLRYRRNKLFANLGGKLGKLSDVKGLDVAWCLYGIENAFGHLAHHLHCVTSGCLG